MNLWQCPGWIVYKNFCQYLIPQLPHLADTTNRFTQLGILSSSRQKRGGVQMLLCWIFSIWIYRIGSHKYNMSNISTVLTIEMLLVWLPAANWRLHLLWASYCEHHNPRQKSRQWPNFNLWNLFTRPPKLKLKAWSLSRYSHHNLEETIGETIIQLHLLWASQCEHHNPCQKSPRCPAFSLWSEVGLYERSLDGFIGWAKYWI